MFFDGGKPILFTNSRGKTRIPNGKSLAQVLKGADHAFLSFVSACLEWDPEKRISAKDALSHEWLVSSDIMNTARGSNLQPHQGTTRPRKSSLDYDLSFKTRRSKIYQHK